MSAPARVNGESSSLKSAIRLIPASLAWLAAGLASLWAAAALFFDFPFAGGKLPIAIAYVLLLLVLLFVVHGGGRKMLAWVVCFAAVTLWWFSLKPSSDRLWMADVSQTAWGEVNGDSITLHNVRNCDYRAEFDYTCQWETRTYDLTQLRGGDFFLDNWGSPWIAHPIVSFDFSPGGHLAMSIETRKTVGQSYSALLGFFRQYTLIVIPADERDMVRLRTNYREGENLYLYRTKGTPAVARELLLDYVQQINKLHARPEWYNALTTNCTTVIFSQAAMKRQRWDWRILLNGKLDELEYHRGTLVTDGLSFPALKQQAWINPAAKAADQSPQFSELIRKGRVGF
jgi:Domain of unknown function (DUF4105)